MDSEPPKVRFVKCPRCMKILPEFANIPVYKCGGCDLILRAKHLAAVGSTRSEESYDKSKPPQVDVELIKKIETINHLKENSSDTSSNSGDKNEAAESSSHKDGVKHISLDSESIELIGKKDNIPSSANVTEHGPNIDANPVEPSLKTELDYIFENHDNVASSNELLPPSPSEVTTSPDFAIRDEFRPSNQSVVDLVGSFDIVSLHEKEELAQIGEQDTKDLGSNYEKGLRSARISHEVTLDGKDGARMSYHSSQATQVSSLPDNDKNLNVPLDAVQKLYTDKMDDAESVISEEATDSKLDGALDNLSKSPATISSRAYYSSLSSNGDDFDISVPLRSRNVHLSRRTGVRPPRGAVNVQTDSPGKEARKSKIIVNSTEVPHVRKMASISSYDQYGTALSHYSDWNQDEQFGSRHAHGFQAHESGNHVGISARDVDSSQSRMEVDRPGASRFLEKIPPYPENLTSIHHNGNVSDQSQDWELMKKVQNLRDELNRLTIERRRFEAKFSGASSDQEPLPAHHGLYHSLHPYGTYGSRTGQQSRSSQLRFAGSSNMRHHLEYSCLHICADDWQCQSQLPCDGCYGRVLHYACPASVSNQSYSPSTSGKHRHVDRSFSPTFHNRNISAFPDTRPLGPDMESLYKKQKDRKVRHCRSIAGAAPFITCYMCWKLLQLPADFLLASRRSHKLQCGACLSVLNFSLLGKNHVVAYSPAHDNYRSHAFDNAADNVGDVVSFSDEYNRSFGKSYSTEDHPVVKAQRSDPDKGLANNINAPSASTKTVDKGKHTSESAAVSMDTASKIVSEYGKLIKLKKVEQRSNSPLHRLMGYTSASEVINCPSNDANSLSHVTVQNGPEKYLAGEMTIRNRPMPMNHADAKSENRDLEIEMDNGSPTKLNNIRDSPIAGHVKKGTKNMNHRSGSTGRKLYVNGKVIQDHAKKRAEEKAGPIHPGNYWYDYRAGFWGVMGKPCLGIIPPYIEEFGYPIAIDCAGGNTGVLVNNRELHEEDLELLATIGFPTERNKVYTVNATGLIIDEDLGQEIGKLNNFAPNIEKTGHGFGMLDPSQNTSN